MKTFIWVLMLGLLLFVELISGSDAPPRTVLFPEDSNEEISQNFDSSKLKQPQQIIGTKSRKKKPTSNPHNTDGKMKFRIDSSDIPCIKNATMLFCEQLTTHAYPTKYVEKMLANSDAHTYANYFNKTEPSIDALALKFSSDATIELCSSFKRLIYPQLAMNVQNDWRFVVQTTQSTQPIRVEICQKKISKCLFNESFPNGYVSACVQKYTKVPLLSLGENGELLPYDYAFPSFCQCELHYKQISYARHRF